MKNNIAIVTDTGCDLPDDLLKQYGIRLIPLRISWKGQDFQDRLELKSSEIFNMMDQEVPKTSLPTMGDFLSVMDELADEGFEQVLFFTISSKLSGTFNAANLWAGEYERMKVTVVDTKALTLAQGGQVLEAAKVLAAGGSLEDALARAEAIRGRVRGIFVVKTLEYLQKGGRISALEGVLGSLLQIKPVITLTEDGELRPIAKGKGFKRARAMMMERVQQEFAGKRIHLTALHCEDEAGATEIAQEVRGFADVAEGSVVQLTSTLATHTGRGLLGMIVYDLD